MSTFQATLPIILLVCLYSQSFCAAEDNSLQKFSKATTKFTLAFYKDVLSQNQQKSFVSSPFSVSTLFSMILAGANGETANEISKTLGFDDAQLGVEQVKSTYKNGSVAVGVDMANSAWNSKNFKVSKEYRDMLSKVFRANDGELDFSSSGATKTMNDWVKNKTNDKIPTLFDDNLPPSTLLVLVNAIFFKKSWKTKFPVNRTTNEQFRGEDGNSAVPMMNVKSHFGYFKNNALNFRAVELDYDESDMSMVVILPNSDGGLKNLEQNLTPEVLADCFQGLKTSRPTVDVFLPRFKLEAKYNLITIMRSLGTNSVFSSAANLSGISPDGGLYITEAVQKAFVEINEEGTTAAAASGAAISRTVPIVITFRADHPFIFLIRNKNTGVIFFVGRYA